MPYQVLPAQFADLNAFVDVFDAAFETDPLFQWMPAAASPADRRAYDMRYYEKEWHEPGLKYFKAVDDTGFVSLSLFLSLCVCLYSMSVSLCVCLSFCVMSASLPLSLAIGNIPIIPSPP